MDKTKKLGAKLGGFKSELNAIEESKEANLPASALRRSFSTDVGMTSSTWVPMKTEGRFIVLMVADTYLTNDFEYSLRISTTDFSYVANTALFEGNILRFRALSNLKIFD